MLTNIYIHVQTQHFLNNIHDSIIRYIERKKTGQTCLRWSKKCADWLLIFISSYFFLFMYVYSDTKMLVTGFSFFLFFFISVCELNKMLVRYIFYCWELVWLCWVFFIKWQIPKCLDFYIIIQMCSPRLLCVFLNEYKIKKLTFFFKICVPIITCVMWLIHNA